LAPLCVLYGPLWIMIYNCSICSVSLVFMVLFYNGSALICQTGYFELRSAALHHQQCSPCAQCDQIPGVSIGSAFV